MDDTIADTHDCYSLLCGPRAEAADLITVPEYLQHTSIRSRVPRLAQHGCNEVYLFREDRHLEEKLKLEAHSHEQSMRILTLW